MLIFLSAADTEIRTLELAQALAHQGNKFLKTRALRKLADDTAIDQLFELLRDHSVPNDRQTWNRRYRGFMEKIRTGSLYEVGEVYRDLSLLKTTKNLSHGERQMLNTARNLVIRELSTARHAPESQVAEELDSMLKV